MSESYVDWDNVPEEFNKQASTGETAGYKLLFFSPEGKEVNGQIPDEGKTKELEYITCEKEEDPKFPDSKGRDTLRFEFLDVETGEKKLVWKAVGSRFYNAFIDARPKAGDKMTIHKKGAMMDIEYKIVKS